MKAPEKIYFTQTENGTHYYTEGIPFERKYIEYIRTDAFIEKACEFLETYPHMSMGKLRSEMIEDFKKYMKGK